MKNFGWLLIAVVAACSFGLLTRFQDHAPAPPVLKDFLRIRSYPPNGGAEFTYRLFTTTASPEIPQYEALLAGKGSLLGVGTEAEAGTLIALARRAASNDYWIRANVGPARVVDSPRKWGEIAWNWRGSHGERILTYRDWESYRDTAAFSIYTKPNLP